MPSRAVSAEPLMRPLMETLTSLIQEPYNECRLELRRTVSAAGEVKARFLPLLIDDLLP